MYFNFFSMVRKLGCIAGAIEKVRKNDLCRMSCFRQMLFDKAKLLLLMKTRTRVLGLKRNFACSLHSFRAKSGNFPEIELEIGANRP